MNTTLAFLSFHLITDLYQPARDTLWRFINTGNALLLYSSCRCTNWTVESARISLLSRELIPIHRLLGRSCQRFASCSGNGEGVSFIHDGRLQVVHSPSTAPLNAAQRSYTEKGDQRTDGVELKTAVLIRPRSSLCARASKRIRARLLRRLLYFVIVRNCFKQ